MNRIDSLMLELSSRHRNNDQRFLTSVRPLVAAILDGGTPDHSRVALLEHLAETFERDRRVRLDCEAAQSAWAGWVQAMKKRFGMA